jgi:DNA-binding NtrC family response regulator
MPICDSKGTGTLPLLPGATVHRLREPARLLVADDDPTTGQLLTSIGDRERYQIIRVDNGRQAYRTLKSDADFNAVVFNMTMLHLEGVEIIRYMKTEKRLMRIPVVIVAGEHDVKLVTDSFAAGALAFLPKPFTTEQLRRTLRVAISSQPSSKISNAPVAQQRTRHPTSLGLVQGDRTPRKTLRRF